MAITTKPNVNVEWAQSGDKTDPGVSKYQAGWNPGEKPENDIMNYVMNRTDTFEKHVNEAGIAAWDASTSYSQGSIVSYQITATNTRTYLSRVDTNVNNQPDTSPTQWLDLTAKMLTASYLEVTGTNSLTATIDYPALTQYEYGQVFNLKIQNANTSANIFLNINSIGSRTLRLQNNVGLAIGDFQPGMIAQVVYVQAPDLADRFFLLNPYLSAGAARPGSTLQRVVVTRNTMATTAITIDANTADTILITDGVLVMQASITPKKIGSKIVIEAAIPNTDTYNPATTNPLYVQRLGLTLHKVGTADALTALRKDGTINSAQGGTQYLRYEYITASVTQETFQCRLVGLIIPGEQTWTSTVMAKGVGASISPIWKAASMFASLTITEIQQ